MNDKRHGGAYDRGSADAYYGRHFNPHYFVGATHNSARIGREDMTPEQIEEYRQGYVNETDRKNWD